MPAGRLTVLLSVQQGFSARYLLRTGVLPALRRSGARVVILTPNADEPYFSAEFADGDNVVVEPLRAPASGLPGSRARRALWTLPLIARNYTLGDGGRSAALRSKLLSFQRKTTGWRKPVASGIALTVRALWRSRVLRRGLLALESRIGTPELHADVFERHRPDVVVAASPGYFLPDALVLREAAQRGIRTVGVVAAWDNPTSKGYRGADPDVVCSWSDVMARQLEEFQDVAPERILVSGVPHFDRYVEEGALLSREELCRLAGLDPERRIVVYATSTPGLYAHNADVAAGLARAIEAGPLADAQLVVRLHPIYFRGGDADLTPFEALTEEHANVHVDVPEVQSELLRCDLRDSDNRRLSSLLKHADVLVCVFSTTTLEAFLVDCPVVFASWTAHLETATDVRPSGDHVRDWSGFEHLRRVVADGAVRVGHSLPELVAHTRAYLDDRSLDHDRRLGFALSECGPTDGHAGERVAAVVLRLGRGEEPEEAIRGALSDVPVAQPAVHSLGAAP